MRIVVDTNVVFSALLNPKSPIGEVLLNLQEEIDFYAPKFIEEEILRYKPKILIYTKLSEADLNIIYECIFNSIILVSEDLIHPANWKKAHELTKEIDEFDTPFVALSIELNAKLWTGDKKLRLGFEKHHPDLVISLEKIKEITNK